LLQALAKSVRSLPSVIVRDFAGDVMENVGLGDTVGSMSTNPTHDWAKITKEVAVQSSQCTTGESELRSTVVREDGVSMLKECNEDKPVVDPEVGYQVDAEHSRESESVDGGRHSGKPEHDAQIRENDGTALVRSKHDGVRVEV
jgi:hypothetical protein